MKMSTMRKHYPTLTGNERFRMAIAALACKDDDDHALLRSTCPMKTYTAMIGGVIAAVAPDDKWCVDGIVRSFDWLFALATKSYQSGAH